jgi:hypothetical protein
MRSTLLHDADFGDGRALARRIRILGRGNPEPAEWMLLLAGLVGLGFIARRKIGLVAGAPA